MQTYLFYDLETTGLNKAFDQVLHFAAIRTDLNLKELRRYEYKIKLNPDVTPSPSALLTHRMGIQEITRGLPELAAISDIHACLNEPGTISLGYNTLGFDDEFLRFAFYRNLLKPYTHQYANGCGRMDIYPLTIMFFLFKNDALQWPKKEGRVSLKLEELNKCNQFIQGRAHHAMVDVEVTLELARCLLQEREMWDYLQGYFKKDLDNPRMQALQRDTALLVNGKLGSQLQYQCPVLFLGNHVHYTNQTIWLRLDNAELADTTEDTIATNTWSINKKAGEPNFILPCKERFLIHLSHERLLQTEKNRRWLQQNPLLLEKIAVYHRNYTYPIYPATDIDARLYLNGFWSAQEENICRRFHLATPKEKAKLTEEITHSGLQTLALRIIGRNFPELLNSKQVEQFAAYLACIRTNEETMIPIDYQGNKRLTPQAALAEIQKNRLEKQLDLEQQTLLTELEIYLQQSFCVA